jgi:hypothetical protein
MSSGGGKRNYYDYLKKYDAHFLNKYESWGHASWSRRSNYLQLLYFRAYSLWTGGRSIFLPHIKLKSAYMMLCAGVCITDIYGIWIYQEMYNKYMPWKWVYYQPYFKDSARMME